MDYAIKKTQKVDLFSLALKLIGWQNEATSAANQRFYMEEVDRRLDRMIQVADETGYPLDHIVKHMGRCDQSSFDAFSDKPSRLPRYMKSSDRP